MTANATNTPYSYTTSQAEVVRLHERYRRCFLDQKYYARRLALYQRWDTSINLFSGLTMLVSLATRGATGATSYVSYGLGFLAVIAFIAKPIFTISEHVQRYAMLHYAYADLFNKIERLVADIRTATQISTDHRSRAEEIYARVAELALQEDSSINNKKLAQFQAEVNQAVPPETLWLPSR